MKKVIIAVLRFLAIFIIGIVVSSLLVYFFTARQYNSRVLPWKKCLEAREELCRVIERYNMEHNTIVTDVVPEDYLSEKGRFVKEGYISSSCIFKYPECSYTYDPKTRTASCSVH